MHLRTAYTRTFRNQDGSHTTAKSSLPLHFEDDEGLWKSIDYSLSPAPDNENLWITPAHAPAFSYNSADHILSWHSRNGEAMARFRGHRMTFVDAGGENLTDQTLTGDPGAFAADGNEIHFAAVFDHVSFNYVFGKRHMKSAYHFEAPPEVPADADHILLEEEVTLAPGWTLGPLMPTSGTGTVHETLALRNPAGVIKAVLDVPVYSDASAAPPEPVTKGGVTRPGHQSAPPDRDAATAIGKYSLVQESEGQYRMGLVVPTNWLNDQRTYPVIIDPVAVLMDDTPMGTCFFPNYEEDMLTIEVPEGDTIIHSYLEWDFSTVAGTQAWMEDQRSYVEGPDGSTAVFVGEGNSGGTQTYSVHTSIANGTSTGSVDFTWFASRVWGGNGCNQSFNMIVERYIEVTHFEEVTFGPANIVINEFTASNRWLEDAFGNYEDMVELYNASEIFADVGGYYLSDNPNNPTKWEIPSVMIPPGGHLVILCSGRDTVAGGVPHAGFRLSQLKPEHILLSNPSGQVIELHPLWVTQNGHSYGRVSDGADEWGVCPEPTFGTANQGHFEGYTSKPQLTPEAGYYEGTVTVEISIENPGDTVYYTLNGHEPTPDDNLYDGPIVLAETAVVRARAFDSEGNRLPGFMETNTYFINDETTMPVFSYSGDELFTLFGGTQIEPLGAVEFFGADGQLIDESYCDFNKHGNDSWQYPQRGVDFISRDEFGYNDELKHNFFPTSDRGDFQRLMVKAAANDNYPFEDNGAHIRDSYVQSFSQLTDLELDERSSLNCLVYVNGEYWGVYDLREKVDDKDFTRYYYDQRRKYKGSEEYVQFIKTWGGTGAKYGEQRALDDWAEIRDFVLGNDMGDSANFQIAEETLDFRSMVDHFVANSFIVSRDWLNYNTGWWRGLNPSGEAKKWKYIMWDMEAAFGHYINWTGLPNPGVTAPPCQAENLTVGDGHAQMLKKLIEENPKMRQKYVTRYADLLNTKFACENLIHTLDSMVAVIAPEMPRQIERWGGSVEEWEMNVDDLRDWINERCDQVKDGLLDCYDLNGPYDVKFKVEPEMTGKIKMNSEWLPSYPFDAFVYGNIETILEPEGNGPYQFSHWEIDNHDYESLEDSVRIELLFSDTATVTAHFINPNLEDDETLLYYWHFNELNTLEGDVTYIDADFKLLPHAEPQMVYTGTGPRDIDHFNNGSDLNLQLIEGPGRAARVRNPSIGRSIEFNMPTEGYADIRFEYAVHRSGQGMLQNVISYSVDGETFTQNGLTTPSFNILEDYTLITVDFSSIYDVNDNPNFKIQITFEGNTDQDNGNNRFDNITLKGNPDVLSTREYGVKHHLSVHPNPTRDQVAIHADFAFDHLRITDISGRTVMQARAGQRNEMVMDVSSLPPGVYLLHVNNGESDAVTKLVVQ